jgi:uncharacterized protein (TIGR02996 family)
MLERREAFLRAIFDTPEDDTPRLIFADWLEEQGEHEFAQGIRCACQWARLLEEDILPRGQLAAQGFRHLQAAGQPGSAVFQRGFPVCDTIAVSADLLADPIAFRRTAADEHPEWFGATRLKINAGLITGAVQVETMLTTPATALVTELDLNGSEDQFPIMPDSVVNPDEITLMDFEYRPVITMLGVESLANHRSARRITTLLLENNELDNDAARLLANSKQLIRLQKLSLFTGNRLRGRTWQQLLARFGEEVLA